ncbi:MAG: phosphotransferase [Thermaerobacter sp.]|nr:phosphotransferase [Thermaerobacter sp.]
MRATEHHWHVLPMEERAYRDVAAIRPWAPQFYGAVRSEGWHLLLLEDLKGATWVPPWAPELAEIAVDQIAAMHAAGMADPGAVEDMEADAFTENWLRVAPGGEDRDHFLALFSNSADARGWLDGALSSLMAHEGQLMRRDQPFGIIHCDIRSDNLAFRGQDLVLFDWADVRHGPLAFDIAAFLPSLESQGGPTAASMAERYAAALRRTGIELPTWALPVAASAVAGYFASRAGRPGVAALPRLRDIQRSQVRAALPWAAAQLKLPVPPPPLA